MLTWFTLIPIMTVVAITIAAMLADMKKSFLAPVRLTVRDLSQAEVDRRIAELEREFSF